jgi:phosphate starvation-inducible PhoH-like protein
LGRQNHRAAVRRKEPWTTSQENIIELNEFKKSQQTKISLLPRSLAQEKYIDALKDPNVSVVFATGPAGTGKTMLATLAAIQQLKNKQIEKIIITRPAVSVDEQHGFLPGTLIEKMQPWVLPILDYFAPYYNKKQITNLIEHDVLEIAPLAYMRGRTFNNCFIIADECQNTLPSQMKMLLTRIGMGSKVVVTGDVEQHDRGFEQNGLRDILDRMQPHPSISVCSFGKKDISRHPLIETILDFYK